MKASTIIFDSINSKLHRQQLYYPLSTLSMLITVFILVILVVFSNAYAFKPTLPTKNWIRQHKLDLAAAGTPDPLDEIRSRMKTDPSYNPMADPKAAPLLESLIPDYLKEIPNAVDRLEAALKDATSGTDAIGDLDKMAASFENKQDLISSPQSDFFAKGMVIEGGDTTGEDVDSLINGLREQYPEVPLN